MKKLFILPCLLCAFLSCEQAKEVSSVNPVNWDKRELKRQLPDSLITGSTYLSVYSQVYSQTEHITRDLTATVSLRNIDLQDSIYIDKATYYDTHGNPIRTYFEKTIYIAPMETVEIIIDEVDKSGGTGANFVFDWKTEPGSAEPLFEAVMISTSGQQGLSFSTTGKQVR